jgi:diacylglycerol kinase (ATP)
MNATGAVKRPLTDKRIALIVNPKAAKGRWQRNLKLRRFFYDRFPGRVFDQARDKAEMIRLARSLSLENDALIVFGGDGTLADVMQGIHDAGRMNDVILGIVPFGSGNAVRGSLQIPKAIGRAFKILRTGEPKPIDLIDVNGHIASFLSIGATAKATHITSQSKVQGLLGHLLAARSMFLHGRQWMDVELFDGKDDKGRTFERKTLRLKVYDCIINKTNQFGYNWMIAPWARLDDGYLDVTLFDIRAYSYVFYFPLIYLGHYQKMLKHYKVKRMIVRGKNLLVQYNGETLPAQDRLEIKVLPKALRVIAPKRAP